MKPIGKPSEGQQNGKASALPDQVRVRARFSLALRCRPFLAFSVVFRCRMMVSPASRGIANRGDEAGRLTVLPRRIT
jgi:hypothetical protein